MSAENLPPPIEQMLDLMIESTSLALAPFNVGALFALAWIRAFGLRDFAGASAHSVPAACPATPNSPARR